MSDEKAPFNSALDLLERLSKILSTITTIKFDPRFSEAQKQNIILKLTQDYYIQSIPLLSDDGRTKFKTILSIKPVEAIVLEKGRATNKRTYIFSEYIEAKINDSLINIQMDLQDKGRYFMPPRKDRGKAVAEF